MSTPTLQPSDLTEITKLAGGSGAEVYQALAPDGQPVLLKRFSLKRAGDWKELDLFEREAQVLQQLDHPRIPRLLAYGQDDQGLYLITSLIAGESLAERMERGVLSSEAEVVDLGRQMLEILIWLHGHQPPVIHRDIKPSNLILNAQNELFLIDFGSVGLRLNPEGGSTVAGTFGFMAPEQFGGRALPASDIYSVAATMVHLLSGKSPAEMPQERLRLNFEPYLNCSSDLLQWLQRALNPLPEERFAHARQALAQLMHTHQGPAVTGHRLPPALRQLAQLQAVVPYRDEASAIVSVRTEAGVEIILPALPAVPETIKKASDRRYRLTYLALLILFIPLISFAHLGAWPFVPMFLALLGASGFGFYHDHRVRRRYQIQTHLRLEAQGLEIEERLAELTERRIRLSWQDLLSLEPDTRHLTQPVGANLISYRNAEGQTCRYQIGTPLAYDEQIWLQEQLLTWQNQALAPAEDPDLPSLPEPQNETQV